jgi:hypothetical protein
VLFTVPAMPPLAAPSGMRSSGLRGGAAARGVASTARLPSRLRCRAAVADVPMSGSGRRSSIAVAARARRGQRERRGAPLVPTPARRALRRWRRSGGG